ncbi:MAG: hypothetical protein JSV98_01625 [candidate division WOR-3 bacterium]|nr:MAG: hypothetical protein JSV98_01625 [candidate division WOR-3 bacterium]
MKDCARARKQLVELLEEELAPFEREELLEHISHCAKCTQEYRELKKLYGLMKADKVSLLSAETFEEMRRNVRPDSWVSGRKSRLPRFLAEVLVPVLGVAALLLIILWPRNGTVEFNVPVDELIKDEEIAGLVFAHTVDNEMLKELIIIEGYLLPAYEEAIDELTPEEEEEFILALNRKFLSGT